MEQQERIEREADLLAKIVRRKLGAKAGLRLVGLGNLHKEVPTAPPRSTIDPITRNSHIRRIKWLRKIYGLQWLVDQHVFGLAGPECLEDADLLELHREMEKARECIAENIPLEDVGLIRTQPI